MSLKQTIYNYLLINNCISLDRCHAFASEVGQKQSTVERTMRKLTETGLIETVRRDNGFIKGYRLRSTASLNDSGDKKVHDRQNWTLNTLNPRKPQITMINRDEIYRPEVLKQMELAKQKTLL